MSTTKYYQAQNANRFIAGIQFEITDIVGSTAWGVFQTDDPALQEKLDAVVADKASAVTAITEKEYNNELEAKKKLAGWPTSSPSRTQPKIEPAALKPLAGGAAAVLVENAEPKEDESVEISTGVASVEEALATAPIAPEPEQPPQTDPPPENPPPEKPKSSKKRGDKS